MNYSAASLGRLVVVAALLVAQHSALAHGIWHLAGAPTAYAAASAAGEPQDKWKSALCEQHEALGTILGALGSADACTIVAPKLVDAISRVVLPTAHRAPLSPSSRDPPSLL